MSTRRSYLDTLNAGRQRRPSSALEELNRSLEGFEQRLDRHRDEAAEMLRGPAAYSDQPQPGRYPEDEYRYVPPQPRQRVADVPPASGPRQPQENMATMGRIAVDLMSLRDEVRFQMGTGLKRELDSLRRDIDRTAKSRTPDFTNEFERLAAMIQAVAADHDDRTIASLRGELDQVRSALDTLAREDAERDRRWDALEQRIEASSATPAIERLHDRMAELGETMSRLPASLPLDSIDDKLRTLATAIDHFSRQEKHGADAYAAIDSRLEEISRAIVATSASIPQTLFDPAPFDRIEARIGSLARQVEEIASADAAHEMVQRLNVVTQRIDEIAQRAEFPEKSVEQLARQIAIIADKIEQAPAPLDADQIFQGIDERFEIMSHMIERRHGDSSEHSNLLFTELERRLDEVSDRLDQGGAVAAGFDTKGMMESIDARLDEFVRRIETRDIGSSDGELARFVEARLSGIEQKIDSAAAPQFTGVDPEVLRNLEAQVAAISAHLMRPEQEVESDVAPRLASIERAIMENREAVLDVARQAAEEVARSFKGTAAESEAVKGLAEDMKILEELTRRSEERNTRTFEAIHDTLLKVVDRLATLEPGFSAPDEPFAPIMAPPPVMAPAPAPLRMPPAAKLEIADAPSILAEAPSTDNDEPAPAPMVEASAPAGRTQPERSPAQAAAAAAVAALGAEEQEAAPAPEGRKRSLFGGFSRMLSRKPKAEPALAGSLLPEPEAAAAPAVDLDGPLDPKIANRPLEPGSGTPDLNAIIRRVRDERQAGASAVDGDTGKSDFIAAARRAAQAAAAEADVLKRQSSPAGAKSGSKLADLVKARRRPILMAAAAIMMALAGMQLGKSFFENDPKVGTTKVGTESTSKKAAEAKPVATAPEMKAAEIPAAPAPAAAPGLQPADTTASQPADDGKTAAATDGNVETSPPADTATTAEQPAASAAPAEAEADAPQASAAQAETTQAAPMETAATGPEMTAIIVSEAVGPVPLRDAANAGNPTALFEVATRYAEGQGIPADMASAARFYEKAAELGFAPAQYRIGNFYEKGLGVDRDVAKAKTWYQMAASQGNASAMHNLAVLFAMGADGASDNDSAARWFTEAADLGVKDSQFNLGILTAKGVGVPQNLEESYKWFAIVAKTGDRDAAAKRDEIANALRPEQLEKARAATELWRAKPLDPASNSVDIPEEWKSTSETTASVDMTKAVRNIQALLTKFGYDAGAVDGVMGTKTREAIVSFQKDNNLPATGEVDEKLVKVLLARQ